MTTERRKTANVWFTWVTAVALLGIMGGCSTEVEMNAPYDSVPVVFGLLELEADTQWVKINRTWLGEGDQFEAAAIADSSLYPEGSVEAWMVELIPSSSGVVTGDELPTGREWALSETTLDNREPDSIFTWTEHRVFFAETSEQAFEEDKLYRLELRLPDGKEAKATTTLVSSGTGSISFPPAFEGYELNLATVNPVTGLAQYSDYILRWTAADGARLYTLAMIVNYREIVYTDESWTSIESETDRSLTISLGIIRQQRFRWETCNRNFNTESIYTELASRLEYNRASVAFSVKYDPLTSKSRALISCFRWPTKIWRRTWM